MTESLASMQLQQKAAESVWHRWLSWTYAGVDHSYAGNGGDECLIFIPHVQKVIETIVFLVLGIVQISYAWPKLHIPSTAVIERDASSDPLGRRILLMTMCLTFGAEIGFKLASSQMIWILNQCHVVTILQIYLLVARPSKWTAILFRIQLHCLNGATVAILFPILNTRTLPFEIHVYYLQHVLMLVVPAYLLRLRGAYTPEPLADYSWVYLTLGILLIYHWVPLQTLAVLSHVNLNNIMCPAVSDPFHSRWYRIAAAGHQTLLILIHGKAFVYLCSPTTADSEAVNQSNNGQQPAVGVPAAAAARDSTSSVSTPVVNLFGSSPRQLSHWGDKSHDMGFGEPMLAAAAVGVNGFKLD